MNRNPFLHNEIGLCSLSRGTLHCHTKWQNRFQKYLLKAVEIGGWNVWLKVPHVQGNVYSEDVMVPPYGQLP